MHFFELREAPSRREGDGSLLGQAKWETSEERRREATWAPDRKKSTLGGFPPKRPFRLRHPQKMGMLGGVVLRRFMLKIGVSPETSSNKLDVEMSREIARIFENGRFA